MKKKIALILIISFVLFIFGCVSTTTVTTTTTTLTSETNTQSIISLTTTTTTITTTTMIINDISQGDLRKIVFALVSSAENSSLRYDLQYSYIEDIGDGRGYTTGIIGFTSGTGDLLEVVRIYLELKPIDNVLEKYLNALVNVNGTDSHEGLGSSFISDWRLACKDVEMIEAQNQLLEEMYLFPAIAFANQDGLSVLGQYIYYDAIVMHGPGDDEDSFNGIRLKTLNSVLPPSEGGDETLFLQAFLENRKIIMLKEEAHADLSRINAQLKFIEEKKMNLDLPLEWTMYGQHFQLNQSILTTLK
jgi:chitosanase